MNVLVLRAKLRHSTLELAVVLGAHGRDHRLALDKLNLDGVEAVQHGPLEHLQVVLVGAAELVERSVYGILQTHHRGLEALGLRARVLLGRLELKVGLVREVNEDILQAAVERADVLLCVVYLQVELLVEVLQPQIGLLVEPVYVVAQLGLGLLHARHHLLMRLVILVADITQLLVCCVGQLNDRILELDLSIAQPRLRVRQLIYEPEPNALDVVARGPRHLREPVLQTLLRIRQLDRVLLGREQVLDLVAKRRQSRLTVQAVAREGHVQKAAQTRLLKWYESRLDFENEHDSHGDLLDVGLVQHGLDFADSNT